MTNLRILEFKKSIQKFVQETDLPEEVKRMVLADILRGQEVIASEALRQEIIERDKQEQEVSENADNAKGI